jgi:L-rhamnose-H+ transport protein
MAQPGTGVGILLILAGAFASGSFGLGMKYNRYWKWEHLWLAYSCVGMLVVPWVMGLVSVPHLGAVLLDAPRRDIAPVLLFGAGWGIGSVFYGLSLKLLGMALSFAIVMGLTAAVGSLAPLLLLHPGDVATARGRLIVSGVALIVAGVALSSWAGHLKGKALEGDKERRGLALGIGVAVVSGLLSPMLNLSFAYGGPLTRAAVAGGASPSLAANVIWTVALSGGFMANAGYCAWLIARARSWRALAGPASQYGLAAAMGILWSSGFILYGIGGSGLGELAPVVGWPLMSSMTILSANFWGAVAGEWARSGRKPVALMGGSVVLLCAGMVMVGGAEALR